MAKLNFENYFIDNFSFKENPNFDAEAEQLDVDFTPQAEVNILESKSVAVVILSCTLGDEAKTDCPFIGDVRVTGLFRVEFDKDDKNDSKIAKDFLSQNTITILFPYLRSFIADMTLRTNKFPAFIIPPFNVVEMVKDSKLVTVNYLKNDN